MVRKAAPVFPFSTVAAFTTLAISCDLRIFQSNVRQLTERIQNPKSSKQDVFRLRTQWRLVFSKYSALPFPQWLQTTRSIANIAPPTGQSRCFPFWQEVLACYVVNTSSDDDSGKRKCAPVLEDYYECLHHKKEVRTEQGHHRGDAVTSIQ